jgi:hypothetical protein
LAKHERRIEDTAMSMSDDIAVEVATHMFLHWTYIALREEHNSFVARAKAETRVAQKAHADLEAELQPALVCVTAVASAIDAFYHEISHKVTPPNLAWVEQNRRPRQREVVACLSLGFEIDGAKWEKAIATLYDLRNKAVHPRWKLSGSMRHPKLPVNVANEYTTFTCEAAQDAVSVVIGLVDDCVGHPQAPLQKWVLGITPAVVALRQSRSQYVARRTAT